MKPLVEKEDCNSSRSSNLSSLKQKNENMKEFICNKFYRI